MADSDTILALATPDRPSAVAILRLSGPLCREAVTELAGEFEFRRGSVKATLTTQLGPAPALLLVMPGPASLTTEDVVEVIVPGNMALVSSLCESLKLSGCREAEPGEFTRRALEAGKLDLNDAEAISRLVNASSEAERAAALADLRGETASGLAKVTESLRDLCARLELVIDFPDEEEAGSSPEGLAGVLAGITDDLRKLLGAVSPQPSGGAPEVVLFGPPNAGKSSLMNALLGEPSVLVSSVPGTTRDPVRRVARFGSADVVLVDVGGVGADDVDSGRFSAAARDAALSSRLVLLVAPPGGSATLSAEFETLKERQRDIEARAIWVESKADLSDGYGDPPSGLERLRVSALTGFGMDELEATIERRAHETASGSSSVMRKHADDALGHLDRAASDLPAPPEATASDLRRALAALDLALSKDAPGDVLDHIFSRFCIGK